MILQTTVQKSPYTRPGIAALPANEPERLRRLLSLNLFDTTADEGLDRLTALAASLFRVPIALVSLVGKDCQHFKSAFGLSLRETDRDSSFCAHALTTDVPLVVPDTLEDERFRENPLVLGAPGIRFYAGAQIRTPDDHTLGTLCILDTKPRPNVNALELGQLKQLAGLTSFLIHLQFRLGAGGSSDSVGEARDHVTGACQTLVSAAQTVDEPTTLLQTGGAE